jgi:hypothetical protein
MTSPILQGATFSECRRYRYTLTRTWDESKGLVVFCGLNPSTADETEDDPTIRRELGYGKAWGYGRLVKVNAYAFRSTDPKGLWEAEEPCGHDNLGVILEWAKRADLFVAAWGANIRPAQAWTLRLALDVAHVEVHALKLTKRGFPSHPLYLPKTLKPFVWGSEGAG